MKLFGTDGIRGEAGKYPLDPATISRLGERLGAMLSVENPLPRVIVGGDTRESTPWITGELAAGLSRAGARVEHAGVVPTPAVADLVIATGARAGIAVSASHNPWRDNGIKIFGADGRKISNTGEENLERDLRPSQDPARAPVAGAPAPPVIPELARTFVSRLLSAVRQPLSRLSVLLDCANGAAFEVGPRAFRDAGAKVAAIEDRPTGRNINERCGAVHPERLSAALKDGSFAFGAAFDGDADRVILGDEAGRILDGDDILWILARERKKMRTLGPAVVVGTVMTNFGLESALAREGITLRRTPVGDRYVVRAMEEAGALLGGEPSGHIILRDLCPTGDGIRTALVVADLLLRSGAPLSSLADLQKTPQILNNVRIGRKLPLDEVVQLAREVEGAQQRLSGRGRVLLRYSGTEPLLRVMVEGEDAALVEEIANHLSAVARRELEADE